MSTDINYMENRRSDARKQGREDKERGRPYHNPHLHTMDGVHNAYKWAYEGATVKEVTCDACKKVTEDRQLTLRFGKLCCPRCEPDEGIDELHTLAQSFMECFDTLPQKSLDEFMAENQKHLTETERKVGNAILELF
jgi:hypothetical protein